MVILVNVSIECFMQTYTFALFFPTLCRPIGGAVMRQSLTLQHLFKFFVVRQVCGPVGGFCLFSTYVCYGWKWPKLVLTCWEFSRTESWNCCRPPWWDFPCPECCLRFQRVHESALFTCTCSIFSGIQNISDDSHISSNKISQYNSVSLQL